MGDRTRDVRTAAAVRTAVRTAAAGLRTPRARRSLAQDALALPNGSMDDSEKMLLFPESVIKAAVDTLKEVAIDDFKVACISRPRPARGPPEARPRPA